MKKGLVSTGIGLALGTIILASSCTEAKTTIKFLGNFYNIANHMELYKQLVNEFNKSQNEINVVLYQGGSADKLRAMMAAGTAPDVVHFPRAWISTWGKDGLLTAVEKYVPYGRDFKKECLSNLVQECTWNGTLYGVPMNTDVRGLYWNKQLLDEAGLNSAKGPIDWNGLEEYARKLTRKTSDGKLSQVGFIPWGGNWGAIGWIFTFGGDYYDFKTNRPTFTRPENVKAFDWLSSWTKSFFTPANLSSSGLTGSTHLLFAKNKIGMEAAHFGALRDYYVLNNKDIKVGASEVPHPAGGDNGTWSGGWSLAIPSGSKQKAAAGKFIAWWIQVENSVKWYDQNGYIPPTHDGVAAVKKGASPVEMAFLNQLNDSRVQRPFSEFTVSYLNTALSEVTNGKKSAAAALEDAQQKVLREKPSLWRAKTTAK